MQEQVEPRFQSMKGGQEAAITGITKPVRPLRDGKFVSKIGDLNPLCTQNSTYFFFFCSVDEEINFYKDLRSTLSSGQRGII